MSATHPSRRIPGREGTPPAVVLASASPARRALLSHAGVEARIDPAPVDEGEVKAALRAEGAEPEHVAESLAELKARHVSRRHPGALVIGADQMLALEDRWLDKPSDFTEAAEHLRALSGTTHALLTSACVVLDGTRIWHHAERAELTMRVLSDAFIADYLAALGDEALQSVGAYQLEGLGAQLFQSLRGDFFSILGLPLLPLLGFLRDRGVLAK